MKKRFVLIPPARDEFAALLLGLQVELRGVVKVLEENGTLEYPDGQLVDNEARIFEMRVHDDEQQGRVLYYYWNGNNVIYGLVVFVKKTRRTPHGQIELAQKRLKQLKNGKWRDKEEE